MKRKCLTLLLPLWLISFPLSAQIPTNGLVAFYPFMGNVLDSSGSGNHALVAGCSYVPDRFGNPASALALDGIGDSLILPIAGYTPLTGDFSFSFWVKCHWPEPASILSLTQYPEDTTDNYNFCLNYYGPLQTISSLHYGTVSYFNGSGWVGNRLAESNSMTYTDGEWKHLLVRRRNDTLQLWNRRYPLAEIVHAGPIGDALPFVVGALPFRYKGTIDDMAFYGRALTDQEIIRMQHDHQPYIFTSNRNTDAFSVGDTAEIWWVADTTLVSDSIDLDYSTDGGTTWLSSGHNHGLDYTPFRWPLPFGVGTEVDLRIQDHFNPGEQTIVKFRMSTYKWELVDDSLPFTPRDGVGMLNYDGKLWLLGGWDPPYHASNDYTHSEVYNSVDGIHWNYLGDAPWRGRHDSGWLVHDSAIWVVGGDYQSGAMRDVWRTTDGINWTQILDTIPNVNPLVYTPLTASFKGEMYFMGGQPYGGSHAGNSQQVRRSPDGLNWTRLPDAPWLGRGMVANSVIDDQDSLWILGGGRELDRRCYNDVWKTGDGVNWEQVLEAAPWDPRYWHNMAYFDHKMWVMCGVVEQTNAADIWYSSDGRNWYELKNPPFEARHAASATVFDNSLWLMCGITTNDSWRLRDVNAPLSAPRQLVLPDQIQWYPNPTGDRVNASMRFESALVINGLGQTVRAVDAGQQIDLSDLPAGAYLVRAMLPDGKSSIAKVMKY
ncbi:MAG TPA: LamG-like jellyroll fold domain-containing protein [Bacteroidia bacterium]|nr:LamG-like jellyroll fold domain-containing protein [Bacteroidia bacterium]